jgi:hypothetical protein
MPKSNAGAKGKYKYWISNDGLTKLQGWARDGLSDEQIAHNVSISPSTLYEWKNKYKELSEALKKGKEVVDREVENALLKRARGYSYDEITQEPIVVDVQTGATEIKVTKIVRRQVAPDVTAQIFWLKNRKPDEWRDKRDIDLNVTSIADELKKARERAIKAENVRRQ